MAKKIKSQPAVTKNRQTFVFHAPEAENVQLVGDFTQWQQQPISLEKNSDGTWQVTVDLEPGQYNYRFLVDGEWCDDPECASYLPNPYGGRNSVRRVI